MPFYAGDEKYSHDQEIEPILLEGLDSIWTIWPFADLPGTSLLIQEKQICLRIRIPPPPSELLQNLFMTRRGFPPPPQQLKNFKYVHRLTLPSHVHLDPNNATCSSINGYFVLRVGFLHHLKRQCIFKQNEIRNENPPGNPEANKEVCTVPRSKDAWPA